MALLGAGGAAWYRAHHRAGKPVAAMAHPVPGEGVRVQVEVLNASGVTGLARIATQRLRDAGIDVVYFGSDTTTGVLDTTQVVLRRGDDSLATLVRKSLGAGAIRTRADPSRLVDVTVRLGVDFAPVVRQP